MGVNVSKEVNSLHLPDIGWTRGSWNGKHGQFGLLGRMIGLSDRPSSEELQEAIRKTAVAKVFHESVESFMAATGRDQAYVVNELMHMNKKLGTMEMIPFRSMLRGAFCPSSFDGVGFLTGATVSWMELRWSDLLLAQKAGAHFKQIVVLGSSRICNSPADRRHPYISGVFPEGREPTERELLKQWVYAAGKHDRQYVFPELPEVNEQGKPLSLEEQLRHLDRSGQWEELVGVTDTEPVYVPTNPNALFVPLHFRRVIGLHDIWFSQAGAHVVKQTPEWWWPGLQDVMTTPSGTIRLWIELVNADCITT